MVVDIWTPVQSEEKTPILLIHGWGASGGYWEETARHLAKSARVYVPDLPGTGRSQPFKQTHDLYDQVNALCALIDAFELTAVQVIGHSMGGAMALLLAEARPQQIKRIVLTSMCFFLSEAQKETYQAIMKFIQLTMRFRPGWLKAVPGVPYMMASRYFYRVPNDPPTLQQGLQDYLTLDFKTAVACATNACDDQIPNAGKKVTVPTLLIACRQDQVMPVENVDYTQSLINHSQVRWMDKCGHLPMVEKPIEYRAILDEFLQ